MANTKKTERAKVEVVWEAPPERRVKSMYSKAVEELKNNVGRWARIRVLPQGTAFSSTASIRNAAGNDERLEIVTRPLDDGSGLYGIYARIRSDEQMKAAKKR